MSRRTVTKHTKHRNRRRNPKKHPRTRRQYGQYGQYGGKLIGEGSYGCVYKPALSCKSIYTGKRITPPANKISKVVDEMTAMTEKKQYAIIDQIDPNEEFHIGLTDICIPDKPKKQPDPSNRSFIRDCPLYDPTRRVPPSHKDLRVMVHTDAGDPFHLWFNKHIDLFRQDTSPELWIPFFQAIERLFLGLVVMAKNHFCHHDIKVDNVMIRTESAPAPYPHTQGASSSSSEPSAYVMNYIDFGLSDTFEQMRETIYDKQYYPNVQYMITYPPEMIFLTQPRLRHVMHKMRGLSPRHPVYQDYLEVLIGKLSEPWQTQQNRYIPYTYHIEKHMLAPRFRKTSYPKMIHHLLTRSNDAQRFLGMMDEAPASVLFKLDTYSLGILFAQLWASLFDSPFGVPVDDEKFEGHPFRLLEPVISHMIDLNVFTRAFAKDAHGLYITSVREWMATVHVPSQVPSSAPSRAPSSSRLPVGFTPSATSARSSRVPSQVGHAEETKGEDDEEEEDNVHVPSSRPSPQHELHSPETPEGIHLQAPQTFIINPTPANANLTTDPTNPITSVNPIPPIKPKRKGLFSRIRGMFTRKKKGGMRRRRRRQRTRRHTRH